MFERQTLWHKATTRIWNVDIDLKEIYEGVD
jgi:hypothetical protein